MLQYVDQIFPEKKDIHCEEFDFLHWLKQENFVFFGTADFLLDQRKGLILENDSTQGLFRLCFSQDILFDQHSRKFKEAICNEQKVLVGKFHYRSPLHRSVYLDVIYVKKTSKRTRKIESISVIIGLFTAKAYKQTFLEIPFLKEKVLNILDQAFMKADTHHRKEISYIFDTFDKIFFK
jgi:glutamate dehydrogenase